MSHHKRNVTSGVVVEEAIQRELGLLVVLVEWFRSEGLLEEIGSRLPLRWRRGDGYSGDDLFFVLLALFASGWRFGVRKFLEKTRQWGPKLAGVCGRRRWPSQTAISRALAAVSTEEVESFLEWLLVDVTGRLKGRPDLDSWRDRNGAWWSILHWDSRVTPFRQRALPAGPGLPEPKRRMDRVAALGYAGRKQRADVQWSVSKVVAAGSGQFVNVRVGAGNGSVREQLEKAHEAVERWCILQERELERCLVISDGVARGYEQVMAGLNSKVRFLTRFSHYPLLEDKEAAEILQTAKWEPVDDSGSGPKREAMSFGTVRSEDGAMDLVVSRYHVPVEKEMRGCGYRNGEWVYELFGTNIPTGSFSAGDLVMLYYSRAAIENNFACENREFAAGHMFSTNTDGQELCLGVAAFVWNMQTALGVQIVQAMAELPSSSVTRKERGPSLESNASSRPVTNHLVQEEKDPPTAPQAEPTALTEEPIATEAMDNSWWEEKLRHHENWTWDAALSTLRCPSGFPMRVKHIIDKSNGEKIYRFRGAKIHCKKCTPRPGCMGPRSLGYRRELTISLTAEEAVKVSQVIRTAHTQKPGKVPTRWFPPTLPPSTTEHPPQPPILRVAEIRHILPHLCQQAHILIQVNPGHVPPKPSRFIAISPADRQRRRKTWAQRRNWNALPDDALVITDITAPIHLANFLLRTQNSP